MNTKRFYVVDQDNNYYCCKTETRLFEDVLRRFSFDQIGLTLNDKRVVYDHFRNGDTGHYYWQRREYKVELVVFDHLWRVLTHDQLSEIYDQVVAEKAKKRHKKYYGNRENYIYRYDPVPHTGGNRWSFSHWYRSRIRTTQERRMSFACDPKYIRKKRSYVHLPQVWDDYPRSDRHCDKSWKKNKKKRQWM